MFLRLRQVRWFAALLLTGFFALFLCLWIGIRIDANAYRGLVGRWLSERLGRVVHLEGAVALEVGIRPHLVVHGLRIQQPQGFVGSDFARVGELQIRLDLLPLWHGQLRAESLSASNVDVSLIHADSGQANWIFDTANETPAKDTQETISASTITTYIDIKHIRIERLRVTYQGTGTKISQLALDRLDAQLPANGQLSLNATGHINQGIPYTLKIRGGTLVQLTKGKSPWPVELQLSFANSTFNTYGTISPTLSQLRFGLGTSDIASFGSLFDIDLPNAGVAGVSGSLSLKPGDIQLNDLSAQLGLSSMTGALAIDTRTERTKLIGKLAISRLDLRPFLGQDAEENPPSDIPALYRSLSHAKINLQALNHQDVDLALSVDEWISLPGDVKHTTLAVKLNQGKFSMPMSARLAGVPFRAEMTADGSRTIPTFHLALSSDQADVGGLAQLISGIRGIKGQSGQLHIKLASQGQDGASLMRALSVQLDVRDSQLSYGNLDGGQPIGFRIQHMHLSLPAGHALEGQLTGTLLGKSLQARLTGSDLHSAMQSAITEFTLTAQARGFTAHLASTLNAEKGNANVSFSLGAERASDVAVWLGLRPDARAALALAGRVSASPTHWQLSDLVLKVGSSSLHADLQKRELKGRSIFGVVLDVAQLDAVELDQLLPTKQRTASRASVLHIPILPQQLVLDDADIRVRIAAIKTPSVSITNLGFDTQLRDGYMPASPFFAELGKQRLDGAIMLDMRSTEPHAQLWIYAKNLDGGQILRDLKLAQTIDLSIERFSLYLDSHSRQLANLIANAQLVGEVTGGKLAWRDANQRSVATLTLHQGRLSAAPAQPLTLSLKGGVDEHPVELMVRSATANELLNPRLPVPFELAVSAARSQLQLVGTLNRTKQEPDLELQLKASGERLDSVNHLLRVAMPPWGPWTAQGRFRIAHGVYSVDELNLAMGSSSLQGQGKLETAFNPARLTINLAAPQIQLDDFPLAGWSATQAPAVSNDSESIRKKAVDTSEEIQSLLSVQTLRSITAHLSVRVDSVIAGKDRLGSGALEAKIGDGRAVIGPASVAMQGGTAKALVMYEPREHDVQTNMTIDVDKFDYGVLARRIKPAADVSGRFSLHMDVRSLTPRLSDALKHGNGKLDFLVWPNEMKADMVDLWAVNLLLALLPTIDPKNESKVNCAVGRFTLVNGKLNQRQLVLDTSKVRVTGTTAIDLANETLHMRLQPQAKTAQFLSLATPLEIKGGLDTFTIGPNTGDVLETIVRFATSVVWVPIKRLFSEKVPEDGADVCNVNL